LSNLDKYLEKISVGHLLFLTLKVYL